MFSSELFHKAWNNLYSGKEAFTYTNKIGYKCGTILYKSYLAHRVIWALEKGYWAETVDHIDRNRSNNRLYNLREVTRSQNSANTVSRKGSYSKYIGVCWDKERQKWHASVTKNGTKIHAGRFLTETEAAIARDVLAKKIHGEHCNLNFKDKL